MRVVTIFSEKRIHVVDDVFNPEVEIADRGWIFIPPDIVVPHRHLVAANSLEVLFCDIEIG